MPKFGYYMIYVDSQRILRNPSTKIDFFCLRRKNVVFNESPNKIRRDTGPLYKLINFYSNYFLFWFGD